MGALTRKQRERLEREELILREARNLLLKRGYLGLTMDRVAAATEYSKGTIYQHFSCKEEILMALSIRTMEKQADLFQRASMFRGRPRERMFAVGIAKEMFVRLYAEDFRCCLMMRMTTIREKTSTQRQLHLAGCERRCMGVVAGIARDAVAQGDLTLTDTRTAESVCFALWSMSFGAYVLEQTDIPLMELGITDLPAMLHQNCHAIMDGYGWQPLFPDWDYQKSEERIRNEVFSNEMARL